MGKPLNADRATSQKGTIDICQSASRINLHKNYPTSIMFEDEQGRIIKQEVYYEWKPTVCEKCKNFGHVMKECRKFIKEEKEKAENQKEVQKEGLIQPMGSTISTKETDSINKGDNQGPWIKLIQQEGATTSGDNGGKGKQDVR